MKCIRVPRKSFLENFSFFFSSFSHAACCVCVSNCVCVAVIFSFFKTWLILGLSFLFSRERGIFFSFVLVRKRSKPTSSDTPMK